MVYFLIGFFHIKMTILHSYIHVSLFLNLSVHSTYTEKLQRNEHIKLYTIYTSTVNQLMELAGRTNYHINIQCTEADLEGACGAVNS